MYTPRDYNQFNFNALKTNNKMAINPLLVTGANAVGGLLGNIGAKRRQRRQHKYNMQMAQYQYDRQYQMWDEAWNREIAYNDPSAQMQRYKDAGVNPHLAYANGGGVNTAQTGALPQYETQSLEMAPSHIESLDLGGLMSKYLQNQMMFKNLRKQEAETKQQEIQAQLMGVNLKDQLKAKHWEAQDDYDSAKGEHLFKHGVRDNAFKFNNGTKMTLYQESLRADQEAKLLNNELSRIEYLIKVAQEENLLTEGEILGIKKSLANAQFDFVNGESFKKLPKWGQAAILSVMKYFGGL